MLLLRLLLDCFGRRRLEQKPLALRHRQGQEVVFVDVAVGVSARSLLRVARRQGADNSGSQMVGLDGTGCEGHAVEERFTAKERRKEATLLPLDLEIWHFGTLVLHFFSLVTCFLRFAALPVALDLGQLALPALAPVVEIPD